MLSLRSFHLFFIFVCSVLSLFLIIWGGYDFYLTREINGPILIVCGLLGMILLTKYLKWFRAKSFKVLALGALIWMSGILSPAQTLACATCYTDPTSPMTRGALLGVAFLGIVIIGVLAFIVVVARQWLKRARFLAEEF